MVSKLQKLSGYGRENQISVTYLSKINSFFQADTPVFSSQEAKGDSRHVK